MPSHAAWMLQIVYVEPKKTLHLTFPQGLKLEAGGIVQLSVVTAFAQALSAASLPVPSRSTAAGWASLKIGTAATAEFEAAQRSYA